MKTPAYASLPAVFWMTRDRLAGELSGEVELWSMKPQGQFMSGGDVLWVCPDHMDDDVHLGTWHIDFAKKMFAGAPDDARQVLKVGE